VGAFCIGHQPDRARPRDEARGRRSSTPRSPTPAASRRW
jgi:hypothetical protein